MKSSESTEDTTVLDDSPVSPDSPGTDEMHRNIVRLLEQVKKDTAALGQKDRIGRPTKIKILLSHFGSPTCSILDRDRAYTLVVSSLYSYPRDLVNFFRYWILGGSMTCVLYFYTSNHMIVTNLDWVLSNPEMRYCFLPPAEQPFGPTFVTTKTVYNNESQGPTWIGINLPMDAFLMHVHIKPYAVQPHIPGFLGLLGIEPDHTLSRLRRSHHYIQEG